MAKANSSHAQAAPQLNESTPTEQWRPVVGWEGRYEVSSDGRVRSLNRTLVNVLGVIKYRKGKILADRYDSCGYLRVKLDGGKFESRHRIVALAFLGNPLPGKFEVNHKNGIKTDNRPQNLEYCSRKENMEHAFRTGLCSPRFARIRES